MKNRKEVVISAFIPDSGGWSVVVWSFIENERVFNAAEKVLLQTLDGSRSWIFSDMNKAYVFCFDNSLVPVDRDGSFEVGDLNSGFGEAEAVPVFAWRRYWKKEELWSGEEAEYYSPDWKW